MLVFLFLFFSMLLLCSFFRLKELFQVKNGLSRSLLFFFESAKKLGRSDDAKRRKKRGWPYRIPYNLLKAVEVAAHCLFCMYPFDKNWQSLRYLYLRKYVICCCIQRNTTEKIVTVHTSGSRLVWQIEERTWASTVCNKIYNFQFSAYFKLFARSETKDHHFTSQVRFF